MSSERDEYEVFLDTWRPSEILEHATLPSNLRDPLAQERLLADATGAASLTRTAFTSGTKVMTETEEQLRKYEFFEKYHAEWAAHFRELVLDEGIDKGRFDQFVHGFVTNWVDGLSRRQNSSQMIAIKASIQNHDLEYHPAHAGCYVLNPVPEVIVALFDPSEMAAIFSVNERLLETLIPDYLDELVGDREGSINELYVRRGVYMPKTPGRLREELHYLSSYSLALGPVEQFAQTWTEQTKNSGVPTIFSAPLPALQKRVVAFAPFIEGMDLRQLELVVAPPVEPIQLTYVAEHGGIREYEFQ